MLRLSDEDANALLSQRSAKSIKLFGFYPPGLSGKIQYVVELLAVSSESPIS